MPSITDLKNTKKTNKTFQKEEYRPWEKNNKISSAKENKEDALSESKKNNINTVSNTNDIDLEKFWRGLYGANKAVLELLVQDIEETYDEYVITNSITINKLILECSLPPSTIRSSLQNLKRESIISSHETKRGRGGFARYKISKNTYKYFIEKFSSLS